MRENPLRSLRISLGLSQKQLAKLANVTPQVVLRNEQGIYTSHNVSIASALIEEFHRVHPDSPRPPTYHSLDVAYSSWVRELRQTNGHLFNRAPLFKLGPRPVAHPFRIWREMVTGRSRMAFCKSLAVHPSIVQSYEEGRGGTLPEAIRIALVEAEVPSFVISELEGRCEAYSRFVTFGMEIPARYVRDSDLQQAG